MHVKNSGIVLAMSAIRDEKIFRTAEKETEREFCCTELGRTPNGQLHDSLMGK
jgi:hypothetical protein